MSRFPDLAALAFAVGLAGSAMAEPIGLGRPATPDEVAAWDIDVRPDGLGLREGIGSVADGESIFTEQCASCHGDFGEAVDRWPVLAGGQDTLTEPRPVKTIGSYWPYLSTVWDYVHRAMPFGNAQSLSSDETYALTAYLLYLNDMVDDDFELSRETFTDVVMPNADGSYPDDRMQTAVWKNRTPCMTDCKTEAKITARARVINVTPDDPTSPPISAAPAAQNVDTEEAEVPQIAAAPAVDPALVKAGEKVFKKCSACHAVGDKAKHKIGPHLNGLFGRIAGTAEGFRKYSKDMQKAGADGLVWDEKRSCFPQAPVDDQRTKMVLPV